MRYITKIVQPSSSTGGVTSVAGHTGSVTLTKTDVGLGNVDNTSDINKPVSTATQTALNTKAPVASPLFTGTPAAPTATTGTNTNQLATTAFVQASVAGLDTSGGGDVSGVEVGSFYYFDKDATVPDKCISFTQKVLLDPALYPELANVIPVSSESLQATLNNPTPASSDIFGNSVAISGDYAIVGARLDDTGAKNTGSAYIYVRSGTTWSLQSTLNNPTTVAGDEFGHSVAISGDYAIVGAYLDDTGANASGSAYIYVRNGTTWSLQATLNNPTPAAYDQFGWSVAISGDYAIVGAIRDNTGATEAGSGYIYVRSGTTWSLQTTLNNPTPADSEVFGYSVAISGDYVIMGAYNGDGGIAYIYVRSGTTWSLQTTLNNPTPAAVDEFGVSVAISGDYAIVGAYGDDTGATDVGSAYIYARSGTTWSLQSTLNNPTPVAYDRFGYSVAISGDYAIIGAHNDDTGSGDAGSAYIYVRSGTTWSLQATLNNPTPVANDWFGYSVAISGDYATVGASQDDTGATYTGSAYIYGVSPPNKIVLNPLPSLAEHKTIVRVKP